MTPFPSRNGFAPSAGEDLPQYHQGMLEVKLRSNLGAFGAVMTSGGPAMLTRAAAATTPGLGTLMAYERSGLIRRVTPLASVGVAEAWGETPMLMTFAAASSPLAQADPNANVVLVELHRDQDTRSLEGELRRDPTVESVARVPVRYLLKSKKVAPVLPAAAAPPASSLWNLSRIRWAAARQTPGFAEATAIKVAVLDTGLDRGHPDGPANVAHYEFDHPTDATASSARDLIGHGTHVSGTIAARINNAVGVNGICDCTLSVFKIFDDIPDWYPQQGYFAYFVEPVMYQRALSRCLTLGVDVINLSIGGPGAPTPNESLLFSKLIQAGTTVVAAMGNDASSLPSYPAAIPDVLAVGACSIDDTVATFSNSGGHISLVAPGVGIWSTLPTYAGNTGYFPLATFPPQPDFSRPMARDTNYASWDGTSMASPHVAAAVALLRAKRGAMSPAAVRLAVQAAAVKVAAMGGQNFTPNYGYGRLDLVELLK